MTPQRNLFYRDDSSTFNFDETKKILRKQGRLGVERFFTTDPDEWLLKNHEEEINYIKQKTGLKVRVNITQVQEMRHLLPFLVTLSDLVVFSPGPAWCCSYIPLLSTKPWPGFAIGLRGLGNGGSTALFPLDIIDYFAWTASVKPLVEAGNLTYLPRLNENWERSSLACEVKPQANWGTEHEIPQAIMEALFFEYYASEQLGCIHLDLGATASNLLLPSLSGPPGVRYKEKSFVPLKLNVPYVKNASSSDLWSIVRDEFESFDNFRRSLRRAISEIEKTNCEGADLQRLRIDIQQELIDRPLAVLQARLKLVEKIRRKKYALYSVAAVSATALASTGYPELATGALAGVSIVKLMESYFTDLERDVGLRSDPLYWLARLAGKK